MPRACRTRLIRSAAVGAVSEKPGRMVVVREVVREKEKVEKGRIRRTS